MALPGWIARAASVLAIAVSALFALAAAFAAAVMPYRFWDSLAFGSWSRSIAETGDLWANADALKVSRPLFYVPQGLIWRLADEVWLGRMFSAAFGAVLVVCVWFLARRLTQDRSSRALLAPLAVLVTLSSSVFATFVAAGMTDVPVAAATAATALVLWSRLPARLAVPLAAVGACATILAKPSGLLALVGLAAAAWVLAGRASLPDLGGLAAGAAVALAYDAWQASRLDVSLTALLRAGNDDFWLARGDAARLDALAGGDWVGEGARLLVVLGLAYGIGRAAGAGPRLLAPDRNRRRARVVGRRAADRRRLARISVRRKHPRDRRLARGRGSVGRRLLRGRGGLGVATRVRRSARLARSRRGALGLAAT